MAEDPLQDFLKREEDAMAGLDDTSPPQQDNFATEQNGFSPENPITDDLSNGLDPLTAPPPAPEEPKETPTLVYEKPKVEPEKIRIWKEEFKNRITKKDAEEEVAMEKMRQQAKKELEDWYKKYQDQLEKNNKQNKGAEEEFIRERDAPKPGKEWEKITGLCEFNPKSAKNTKDVSRLRGMLLQLKAGGGEGK